MTRAVTMAAVCVGCFLAWLAAWGLAAATAAQFWREMIAFDAQGVLAMLILAAGFSLLGVGAALRFAASQIEHPIAHAIGAASRRIVAGGALFMAAACGAILVLEVA